MYLEKVCMKNFKSYGKRTVEIKLSGGLTILAGPNGSGKSNITDAIDFVLSGKRSAKKLRAKNFAGLIFDGGEKKRAAKNAEVKLIFDNKDRKIDVEADRVVFTKKIKVKEDHKVPTKRKIKTYYYINGNSSSHTEFDTLFSAARLSTHGHNLVKQGAVNDFAEDSTPTQRRLILDDIAGVTSLDDDIEKGNKRKERVKGDLEKLDFFIGEIDNKLRELDRERSDALKFKKYKEDIKRCRAMLALSKKQSLEDSIQEMSKKIADCNSEIQGAKDEISYLRSKRKEVGMSLRKLKEQLEEIQDEETRELVEEIRKYQLEVAKAKDRKITAKDNIEELRKTIEDRAEDIRAGEKKLKKLNKEREKLERKYERTKKTFDRIDEEYREMSLDVKDVSKKFSELRKEVEEGKRELEKKEKGRNELLMKADAQQDRVQRRLEELGSIEDTIKNLQLEVNESKWSIREKKKEHRKHKKELKKKRDLQIKRKRELLEMKKEEKEINKRVTKLNKRYNELKYKKKMAEETGYGSAVRKLLEARDSRRLKGIHGTIAQLAEVAEEYELALSTAAGGRIQAIVTENDEYAAKAMQYLKRKDYGRGIFLPLNKMTGGRPGGKALMVADKEGVFGFAMDLVRFNPKYRDAFWYVFSDTLVVRDLDTARKYMGGVRLVTLDGQLTGKSGAMVGGSKRKRLIKFGKQDDTEFEQVREKLKRAQERQEDISDKEMRTVDEISDLRDGISDITTEITKLEGELSAVGVNLKEFEGRLEKVLSKKTDASADIESEKKKLTELEEKIDELGSVITEKENKISKKEDIMVKRVPENLQDRMEELRSKRSELLEEKLDLESNLKTLGTETDIYEERVEELREKREWAGNEKEKEKEAVAEAEKDIKEFDKEVKVRKKVEDQLTGEIKKMNEEIIEKDGERRDIRMRINELGRTIEARRQLLIQHETGLSNLREELGGALVEISGYDMEIAPPYPPEKELQDEVRGYKEKLEGLGDVNMRALEKYEIEQKKKGKYKDKYDKLVGEKKALMKMVRDIKKEKKKKLMEVFEIVNENFQNIYPKICRNGEGYLALENKRDPFKGGLIVRARPPGEKMRDIQFISGGEKSQVAIAFILALQQYDPSPLYVLDEVDQNLDSVNSEIIMKTIKRYSSNAQFIMITLHKALMNYADTVYACYRKDGESELVSIQNVQEIPEGVDWDAKGEELGKREQGDGG